MTADGWTRPAYEAISRRVSAQTGLAFPASRHAAIEIGIRRAMSHARIADPADYLKSLSHGELTLDGLIDELTVGETFFFRDNAHYEFIRREVLPDLRRRCGPEHVLKAWSAGCASGEEAYSLAILFEEAGLAGRSRILATDISQAALAKARNGIYGAWSMRSLMGGTSERYFRRKGSQFHLVDRIRDKVTFDRLNLAFDIYPGRRSGAATMDLILCRNVLIYLEAGRIAVVARRLFDALAEGGWLVTGPSDPLLSNYAPFHMTLTPAGIVYRRLARPEIRVGESDFERERSPLPSAGADAPAPRERAIPSDAMDAVRQAFQRGDYAKVVALTRDLTDHADACDLRIRSLANVGDAVGAEALAAAAVAKDSLSVERHLLHAIALMELRRYSDAGSALRRALYLDRTLAVAHLMLGTVLCRLGELPGAKRAYRNSYELASARPPDELVPFFPGEAAGWLARAARAQMTLLNAGSTGAS